MAASHLLVTTNQQPAPYLLSTLSCAGSVQTLALIALTIQTCASYDPPAKPPDMDCTFKDEASGQSHHLLNSLLLNLCLRLTGTTYDLTDLMALNPGITQDRISTDNADYRYTFGVCSTVEAPKECRNSDGSSRVVSLNIVRRYYYCSLTARRLTAHSHFGSLFSLALTLFSLALTPVSVALVIRSLT